MMKTQKLKIAAIVCLFSASALFISAQAAKNKNKPAPVDNATQTVDATNADAASNVTAAEKAKNDETRYPIGCRPVGYEQKLRIVSLFPGKEGALQAMYFFYNKLPESLSLYQMRDQDSELSTRYNHTIRANSWAVLATGEPLVKFICSLGDGRAGYGKIVDCAESIKVCEYVNVKFGLNNKGNYWIVDSNTRNGAVSEVVHYGIIPGV